MKYAVVTGASTGIGRSAAQELAKAGWHVFGAVRRQEDADDFKRDLGEMGTPLIFDVTDDAGVARAAAEVAAKVGAQGVDLLVNNAGVFMTYPLQYLDLDAFRRLLEVNTISVVRVTQAFLPLLGGALPRRAAPGRIINMSSVGGRMAGPLSGAYCATKFALEALSDSLRAELLVYGIDVVVVEPGTIYTPLWNKLDKDNPARLAGTAYGKAMAHMTSLLQSENNLGLPAEAVGRLVARIAGARRPKARYLILRGGPWLARLLRLIPTRMNDRLIAAQFKLT